MNSALAGSRQFLCTMMDWRAWRFAAVGIANTTLGLGLIFGCKALLGLGDVAANVVGYAFVLLMGFALNKHWTFEHRGDTAHALGRYLLVLVAAYAANLGTVLFAIDVMHLGGYRAQALGVVPYAATGYLGSRFFAFEKTGSARRRWQGDWPEMVTAVAFLATVTLLRAVPLGHDAVWGLWIARQLAHGVQLYSGIVEVNPPLWFWMGVPFVWLSEFTGSAARDLLRLGFFAELALSLLLVAALRRDTSPASRLALYLSILLAGTIMVLPDFGQRDQYALVACVPYVTLMAARAETIRPAPGWLAAVIALFAATGLALKIHFILVPLALEGWLWFKLRGQWCPIRPESLTLAACAATYAASVLVVAPEYLHSTVPFLLLSYPGFGDPPSLLYLAFPDVVVLSVLAMLGTYFYRGPRSALGETSLLAAMAFLIGYFAQAKGWRYHTFPALGLLMIYVGAESTTLCLKSKLDRPGSVALGGVLLVGMVNSLSLGPYQNDQYALTGIALAGMKRGETAMVLAATPVVIWPMVEDLGLLWPSRYMSMWMLPAIVPGQTGSATVAKMKGLARTVRDQTFEDLACHPPRRIVIDDAYPGLDAPQPRSGVLDFLRRDPDLRLFLEHYRPGPKFGRLSTLDLMDLGGPPHPKNCRPLF